MKFSYTDNNIILFISSTISFSNPQINIILCHSETFFQYFTVYDNKYNHHFIVSHKHSNILPYY